MGDSKETYSIQDPKEYEVVEQKPVHKSDKASPDSKDSGDRKSDIGGKSPIDKTVTRTATDDPNAPTSSISLSKSNLQGSGTTSSTTTDERKSSSATESIHKNPFA